MKLICCFIVIFFAITNSDFPRDANLEKKLANYLNSNNGNNANKQRLVDESVESKKKMENIINLAKNYMQNLKTKGGFANAADLSDYEKSRYVLTEKPMIAALNNSMLMKLYDDETKLKNAMFEAFLHKMRSLQFKKDPALRPFMQFRRNSDAQPAKKEGQDSSSSYASSSREMKDWKEEFKEFWQHKKYEAMNLTKPVGDSVNMVAARPWGVLCGDPNQHDMPWGSCMMPAECEPELRIYRGDFLCGRTPFVCCGVQVSVYDNYIGFDVSFDGKGLSTDSEERKNANAGAEKKKTNKDRKERARKRVERTKKIKKRIKKIRQEINKILQAQYKNSTRQKNRKVKQLQTFVKYLKKEYKKDRQALVELNTLNNIKVDNRLMKRLNQIMQLNKDFNENATFREIVVNGTITREGAKMLVEAYPELKKDMEERNLTRRQIERRDLGRPDKAVVDYDIEYGYVYS